MHCAVRHNTCNPSPHFDKVEPRGRRGMNLAIWLPALLVLGLVIMGLVIAFVYGCEKV